MTTYFPDQGCYRCIHPNPPNPSTVTNCSEGGVIGAVCGVIGSIQATETLKILANNNPEERNYSLKGKMILYDGLRGDMRTIRLRGKQTGCKLCGTKEITKLIGRAFLRDSDLHQYNCYRNGSNLDQGSVPCKVCTWLRIHFAIGRRDSIFRHFVWARQPADADCVKSIECYSELLNHVYSIDITQSGCRTYTKCRKHGIS